MANRRVFYDFTLSLPKSVSVVALMQDERIMALHNQSVRQALLELEKFASTRIRKSGQDGNRNTRNIVTACFRHETSRELDPHLHTHCVTFNATFDAEENRWKALQVEGMFRAQRFVENCYFHEIAKGLRGLGYELENQGRAFQIKGVPASVMKRFSKRHDQINSEVQKRLERDGWTGNLKDLRERVASEVRKRKMKASTAEGLHRPTSRGRRLRTLGAERGDRLRGGRRERQSGQWGASKLVFAFRWSHNRASSARPLGASRCGHLTQDAISFPVGETSRRGRDTPSIAFSALNITKERHFPNVRCTIGCPSPSAARFVSHRCTVAIHPMRYDAPAVVEPWANWIEFVVSTRVMLSSQSNLVFDSNARRFLGHSNTGARAAGP